MLKDMETENKKRIEEAKERIFHESIDYSKNNDTAAWLNGLKKLGTDKRAHYAKDPPSDMTQD